MNKTISVTATCTEGHKQTIQVYGMAMEWAKAWAALMDGTSAFYVASPRGTDSMIGKCGICGSQIDCTVEEEVDRSARVLVDGSPVTEDHREINPATGQQKDYVVLDAEERAKGFVRPVRRSYIHVGLDPKMNGIVLVKPGEKGCGSRTSMALVIAETYARDPGFYSGTFCSHCGTHRPLEEFVWEGTTERVGS
jgi:hypothetical protein